jgi:hypothetical protein
MCSKLFRGMLLNDALNCQDYTASLMNEYEGLMKCYWQGKTEAIRGNLIPLPLRPPQLT